jgi:hypothetical protein
MDIENSILERHATELGFSIAEQEAMDRGNYEANKKLTNNFSNPYQALVDIYVHQQAMEGKTHD